MLEAEMLVFTRTLGEAISFADPRLPNAIIEVQIIEIQAEQIKLGITAPRTLPIHRLEIWDQVQQVGRRLEERAFD